MGVSQNGGTQQPLVVLPKMIILGCEMGVPPFMESPIYLVVNTLPLKPSASSKSSQVRPKIWLEKINPMMHPWNWCIP